MCHSYFSVFMDSHRVRPHATYGLHIFRDTVNRHPQAHVRGHTTVALNTQHFFMVTPFNILPSAVKQLDNQVVFTHRRQYREKLPQTPAQGPSSKLTGNAKVLHISPDTFCPQKVHFWLGVMPRVYNPSTQKAEARGLPQI